MKTNKMETTTCANKPNNERYGNGCNAFDNDFKLRLASFKMCKNGGLGRRAADDVFQNWRVVLQCLNV